MRESDAAVEEVGSNLFVLLLVEAVLLEELLEGVLGVGVVLLGGDEGVEEGFD